MKGIKYLLFGLILVAVGSAILIDTQSSLGGGELIFLVAGICFGIKGLLEKE